MNYESTIKKLKLLGNEKIIIKYRNHGVKGDLFGVSFKDLKILKKSIKMDTQLAVKLWNSNNYDARALATMIVDPKQIGKETIQGWIEDCDNYMITDSVASVAAKSPLWKDLLFEWMLSEEEFIKSAGYSIISSSFKDKKVLNKNEYEKILETVKDTIHNSPNRARYSMNLSLISIGSYVPDLTKVAINYANEIGTVEVDHGKTSCETPDAASYIRKTVEHEVRKARRKKLKAKIKS